MLETLLNGILGTGSGHTAPGEKKEESGLGKLLPLIIVFIVIAGGLKLLKANEAVEDQPLD